MSEENLNDQSPKVRGPKGPRPRYFACVAIKDGKPLLERIQAADSSSASSIFESQTGLTAEAIDGPFTAPKADAPYASASASPSLVVAVEGGKFTQTEFKDLTWVDDKGFSWNISGVGVQANGKFNDDELMFVLDVKPSNNEKKLGRRPLANKYINVSMLNQA